MKSILLVFLVVIMALGDCGPAIAAKKKNAPQSPLKPIYEVPMTVVIVRSSDPRCEPICPEWIAAEGEITNGTPAKFREVFKRMGKKQLPIIIRSPGGSIDAALEIGKMIRKRKLHVAVGSTRFDGCAPDQKSCKLPKENKGIYRGTAWGYYGFCNSACPLILAAGTERLASVETSVGVHKPKIIWNQERVYYRETYRMVNGKKKVLKRTVTSRKRVKDKVTFEFGKQLRKRLAGYYASMGVDPAIMDDSEKAAHKDIEILRGDRLDALKLRTSSKSTGTLTDWIICRREPRAQGCVEDKGWKSRAPGHFVNYDLPAQFTVVRSDELNCDSRCVEWIAAEGNITVDAAERLRAVVEKDRGTIRFLVLNSKGGSLDGALRLGRLIRQNGMSVIVGVSLHYDCPWNDRRCWFQGRPQFRLGQISAEAVCGGVCPLVLAAGVMRIAEQVDLTNFDAIIANKADQSKIDHYLAEMGIDGNFGKSLRKPTAARLNRNEMLEVGLVTSKIDIEKQDESEQCTSKESPARCVLQ